MKRKLAPVPEAYEHLPQWAFGDSKQTANELCDLVLAGTKTATANPLYSYELNDEPVPEPGERNVVLDGSNRARCVIEYVEVEAIPFEEVDAKFAADEGEGDKSLKSWQSARQKLFERQGYFSPDMLLVCTRFRVVQKLVEGMP
jgi:uncharacterized protein YhfF